MKLKRIFLEASLPDRLMPLQKIASNLWWSWNHDAIELFRTIDPETWAAANYNPLVILYDLDQGAISRMLADSGFLKKMDEVEAAFDRYMAEPMPEKQPSVAYFCMEYGLHSSIRLYSGGLGVLAGDFIKEASDSNANFVAVGLLYRHGYFLQELTIHGDQINKVEPQSFSRLPLEPVRDANNDWVKVSIDFPGRAVWAKIWKLMVGRVALYLLDTDIPENNDNDKGLTGQLYGGDNEHRLKQEILLGIGGLRALKAMGIDSDVYHSNEGHPAFLSLERIRNYLQEGKLMLYEALEMVRTSFLFTTHTPVPAGHDSFPEHLLRTYMYDYVTSSGIRWEKFIRWGKVNPDNHDEKFSMSYFALRMAQEVNGVSRLHGDVSRKMFRVIYPEFADDELHIGHVTNAVHYPTWIANAWHRMYWNGQEKDKAIKPCDQSHWDHIRNVEDEKIWDVRKLLKKRLLDFLKEKIEQDYRRKGESPTLILKTLDHIDENALVIGFARRFATYKRAGLLFSDRERLKAILNKADRPVLFLFAGKAHPADSGGQGLIKEIVRTSKESGFEGKVIFLENYNMELAKLLVQGADVWMNTPTRPKEASGTSGMKAILNGVLNFSVLDGWWSEGYRPGAGWALPEKRTYDDQNLQNELDAQLIYSKLENKIIPTYFDQDEKGVSAGWVEHIKNTVEQVAPYFCMCRMLEDYTKQYYKPLADRSARMQQNDYELLRKYTSWKKIAKNNWNGVEILDLHAVDSENFPLQREKPFSASLKVKYNGFPLGDLKVEVVFYEKLEDGELDKVLVREMDLVKNENEIAEFSCSFRPQLSGVFEYGFRLMPKHELLPHPQAINLVKWG